MKKKRPNHFYKSVGQMVVSAVTGNAKLPITIAVYSAMAVLLLTYVSAQVLTGVLTQEISELDEERDRRTEKFNKLTAEYVTLSSRARVTQYCESTLGMRQASAENYERFAVGSKTVDHEQPVEFTKYADPLTDAYRFSTSRRTKGNSDG